MKNNTSGRGGGDDIQGGVHIKPGIFSPLKYSLYDYSIMFENKYMINVCQKHFFLLGFGLKLIKVTI